MKPITNLLAHIYNNQKIEHYLLTITNQKARTGRTLYGVSRLLVF